MRNGPITEKAAHNDEAKKKLPIVTGPTAQQPRGVDNATAALGLRPLELPGPILFTNVCLLPNQSCLDSQLSPPKADQSQRTGDQNGAKGQGLGTNYRIPEG